MIEAYLEKKSKNVEKALLRFLPRTNEHPARLSEAMRYAVLSGGKRIRPILAIAACEAVGGKEADVMPAACALEFIHSYSLVHDDLPCMDNDLVRRGKPSTHAKFGEVTALLAGDALLTQAFRILSEGADGRGRSKNGSAGRMTALRWTAEAAGHQGMVGGQALDMEYQGREMDLPTAEYVNTHKSGALIAAALRIGAFLGGGSPSQVRALHQYGKNVGLLFQVVDDIMDRQGVARVIGFAEARLEASALLERAKKTLLPFGTRARTLRGIADFVATRTH